jgi:MOSC domain-containing protein YiiM
VTGTHRLGIGPRVISMQVGRPKEYAFGTRVVRSAIGKTPVTGSIRIGRLGLEGDTQVDLRCHGGPERAICVYPAEHLAEWSQAWNLTLDPGAFGENLTTLGLDEQRVHIGDRYHFGSALLEVSQPREPCVTLAGRIDRPDLVERIHQTRRTGWYMRVLEPGEAAPGLPLVLEVEDPNRVTVSEALRIRLDKGSRRDEVRRLVGVPGLSSGWKVSLGRRL